MAATSAKYRDGCSGGSFCRVDAQETLRVARNSPRRSADTVAISSRVLVMCRSRVRRGAPHHERCGPHDVVMATTGGMADKVMDE